MFNKIIKLVFFGNYFIGVLAVALSLETVIQLRLPFNSFAYYVLLFCSTVMYYTYAYAGVLHPYSTDNPRSEWYRRHQTLVKYSQAVLLLLSCVFGMALFLKTATNLRELSLISWLTAISIVLAVILYYGLLPRSLIKLNLRNTGWLKAFVIGFVWAATVSLLPIIMLQLEHKSYVADPVIIGALFRKNWTFCTVNAIMFDLKDYDDDTNRQLKTFVVRFGLRNTIFFVLTPLCLIGTFFTIIFTHYRRLPFISVFLNVLPFLLLLLVTWSMQRQKNIFFYLIVIDGLVFIKAICGIAGMLFVCS